LKFFIVGGFFILYSLYFFFFLATESGRNAQIQRGCLLMRQRQRQTI